MEGIGYTISNIALFLVFSGGLGFAIAWLIRGMTSGSSQEYERLLSHYQAADRRKKELEDELATLNSKLATTADYDGDEVTALRKQISDLWTEKEAWLKEKESHGKTPAKGNTAAENSEVIALRNQTERLERDRDSLLRDREMWEKEKLTLISELQRAQNAPLVPETAEVEELKGFIGHLQEQVSELEKEKETMAFESASILPLRTELDQTKSELSQVRQRLVQAEKELSNAHTARFESAEFEQIEAERNRLAAELTKLRSEVSQSNVAAHSIEELRSERDKLMGRLTLIEQEFSGVRLHRDELRLELETMKDSVQAAQDRMREAQLQAASLSDQIELANLRISAVGELQARLEELETKASSQESLASELTAVRDRVNSLDAECSELRNERDELSSRLTEMESERQNLHATVQDLSGSIQAFDQERQSLQAKVDQAQSMALESGTIIANLEASLTEAEKARDDLDRLKDQFESRGQELSNVRALCEDYEAKVQTLERALSEMAAAPLTQPDTPITPTEPVFNLELSEKESVAEESEAVGSSDEENVEITSKTSEKDMLLDEMQDVLEAEPLSDISEPEGVTDQEIEQAEEAAEQATATEVIEPAQEEVASYEPASASPEVAIESVPLPRESSIEPDDLEEIVGIGPVVIKALASIGITDFKGVAMIGNSEIDQLVKKIDNLRQRIQKEKWCEQAKVLHRLKHGEAL